ncbi:MAG: hypothetical protein WA679_18655, partial [Pseudolabrys sp.]
RHQRERHYKKRMVSLLVVYWEINTCRLMSIQLPVARLAFAYQARHRTRHGRRSDPKISMAEYIALSRRRRSDRTFPLAYCGFG